VALLDDGQYEEAAEALLTARGAEKFQAVLADTFGPGRLTHPLPAAAILQLPRICSGPVLTTNFDPVLEMVFDHARRPFKERILGMDVKAIRGGFAQSRRVLVKLHGDAADECSRVLTKRDYERAYGDGEPLKPVLRYAMQARPLLFLGCSLGNDRTVRVMEALAEELRRQKAGDLLEHYALMEHPGDTATFTARHERLKQLGILPIWYPTGQRGMIADVLAYLASKAGRNLVSGSVPTEPPHYLLRDAELATLRAKVLAGGGRNVAITGQSRAAGVQGMGGVGKTVLAAVLTRDPEVQRAFPGGIFWLTVSREPKVLELLSKLGRFLPGCDGVWTEIAVAQAKLREALAGKRALLILDDVWQADHAQALNVVSAPGRLLVTTRHRCVLAALDADEFQVNVLSPDAALRMLANWSDESSPERLPAVAAEVARECGYLPLALAMIGAMVKQRPGAWADALELLRSHDLAEFRKAFPDYPYPDLLRAIAVGVDQLSAEDRERYLDMAVFPEDLAIPEGPLQVLWGLTPAKTRLCVDRLLARSLGTGGTKNGREALQLHNLQYDYVRMLRKQKLGKLHSDLLTGYKAKCTSGWASGPDDGWFLQHLSNHLCDAGRAEELANLLLDPRWLERKTTSGLIFDLLQDYQIAQQELQIDHPHASSIRLIEEAIRRYIHFVARYAKDYPQALFQCLWDSCWWYDAPAAASHYRCEGIDISSLPWNRQAPKLYRWMEEWMAWKVQQEPGFGWLRSLRPPPTALGTTLHAVFPGQWELTSISWAPDSKRILRVAGFGDNSVRVWDLASGAEVACLEWRDTDQWSYHKAAWAPAGNMIAASCDSQEHGAAIRIWQPYENAIVATLAGEEYPACFAWAKDGLRLAVGYDTGVVILWDVVSGQELRRFKGHGCKPLLTFEDEIMGSEGTTMLT
jgi:NB-ARC domain/SIR2-like domain/APAF-1 helical domain